MRLSLEYIAGFLDGDGNITATFQKQSYPHSYPALGIDVRFYNQNLEVLESIQETLEGGKIRPQKGGFSMKDGTRSGVYRLEFGRAASRHILRVLLPYLVVKREQAQLALLAIQENSGHKWHRITPEIHKFREDIVRRMSVLNKRDGKAFRSKWVNSVNLSPVPDVVGETMPSQAATGTDAKTLVILRKV